MDSLGGCDIKTLIILELSETWNFLHYIRTLDEYLVPAHLLRRFGSVGWKKYPHPSSLTVSDTLESMPLSFEVFVRPAPESGTLYLVRFYLSILHLNWSRGIFGLASCCRSHAFCTEASTLHVKRDHHHIFPRENHHILIHLVCSSHVLDIHWNWI